MVFSNLASVKKVDLMMSDGDEKFSDDSQFVGFTHTSRFGTLRTSQHTIIIVPETIRSTDRVQIPRARTSVFCF